MRWPVGGNDFIGEAPDRIGGGNHQEDAQRAGHAPLLDLLLDWAPDETVRHRILVENPAALYGFSLSS